MKKSLSILALCICSATAFLFPENQRKTYAYHAVAKTTDPREIREYETGFEIYASIIIESSKNGTFISLKNITHTIISGNISSASADKEKIELSEHKPIFELPIYVPRENNLTDPIIYAHRDDEHWSTEWKKAIVTNFIFDEKNLYSKFDDIFGEEYKYYGFQPDNLHMSVLSSDEHTIEFSKFACMHPYKLKSFELEIPNKYPSAIDECIDRNIKIDNSSSPNINEISTKSMYTTSAFEFFHIFITIEQTFKLLSKTEETIDNADNISLYRHYINIEKFNFRNEHNEPTVQEIINFVEINTNRIENVKIDLNNSIDSNRDVNLLHDKLRKINETLLLEVFQKLFELKSNNSNDMQKIYLNFLSHVNTKSSVSAILNLIFNNKIDSETSVHMLREVTHRYKNPDRDIIEKLSDMIEKKKSDHSEDIVNAALLCITSMIKFFPQKDTLNIDLTNNLKLYLFESISKNQAHETVPLKAVALSNLQIEGTSILDDFNQEHPLDSSIITPNIKVIMMLNALTDRSDLDSKSMSYYQSIVLNSKEIYEVRTMALNILLYRSNTTYLVDTALKLRDEELCTDYYRIFKNIVGKKSYFEDEEEVRETKTLMKKCATKKLSVYKSLYDVLDFIQYLSMKPELDTIMFGDLENSKFVTLFIVHYNTVGSAWMNKNSLYLRIKFFDDIDKEVFMLIHSDISKILSKIERLDMVLIRNDVTVYGKSFTNESIEEAYKYLLNYIKESKKYFLDFSFGFEHSIMTDIGMPVILYANQPNMYMLRTEQPSDQFSFDIRGWNRQEYGMKIYNPMMDIWHGSRRFKTSLYRFSATLKDITSNQISIVPIVFDNDYIGYQTVGHMEVYIDTNGHEQEVLQSCNECVLSSSIEMSSDNRTRKYYPLGGMNDDRNKEFVYYSKYFDCDKPHDKLNDIIYEELFKFRSISSHSHRLIDIFADIWDYFSIFPSESTCGLGIRVEKSNKNSTFILQSTIQSDTVVLRDEKETAFIGIIKINDNILYKLTSNRIYKNDSFIGKKYSWKNSENFVISLNTYEDYNDNIFEKRINISSGYQNDDSVFYNSSTFEIKMKEKRSEKQNENFELENTQYKECIEEPEQTYDKCIASLTTLRDCNIDIKYKNLNENHIKWMNFFHYNYLGYSSSLYLNGLSDNLETGKIKINIQYAIDTKYANISIDSNDQVSIIDYLNINTVSLIHQPYSSFRKYEDNPMIYCEIGTNYVQTRFSTKKMHTDLPEKWTRILSHCFSSECKWEIFAKKSANNPDSLVFNVIIGNNILDFHMNDTIQMHFNKEMVSYDDTKIYHSIANLDYVYLNDQKTILLHMRESFTVIEYNGDIIKLSFISYVPSEEDICV